MHDDVYTVLQAHGLAKIYCQKIERCIFRKQTQGEIPCTLNVNIKQLLFYFLYKQYICTLKWREAEPLFGGLYIPYLLRSPLLTWISCHHRIYIVTKKYID